MKKLLVFYPDDVRLPKLLCTISRKKWFRRQEARLGTHFSAGSRVLLPPPMLTSEFLTFLNLRQNWHEHFFLHLCLVRLMCLVYLRFSSRREVFGMPFIRISKPLPPLEI